MTWLALAAITVAAAIGFVVLALTVNEHAGSGPINHPPLQKGQSYVAWFICAVAALVIVGGLTYGTRQHAQVATNGPPQTTGQSGSSASFDDVDGSNNKTRSSGIVHLPRLYQDADQGSPLAQYLLGTLYQVGEVIPRDDAEAVKWLRRAAEQGLAVAQFALGAAYARGEGLPQDSLQAHMWLSLSAARAAQIAGSQKLARDAQEMRDTVARKMTPEQIVGAEQLARGWKEKKNGER